MVGVRLTFCGPVLDSRRGTTNYIFYGGSISRMTREARRARELFGLA